MSLDVGQTEKTRVRMRSRMQRRELLANLLVAASFLACALSIALLADTGPVPWTDFWLLVAAAALLGRFEFEIGNLVTVPTQLIFVPMLFVLPPEVVPLAVLTANVLDRVPYLLDGRWHPQRLLISIGDAWYSVGPALVFLATGVTAPAIGDWPIYALALGTQLLVNLVASIVRERLAHGVRPSAQLDITLQIWFVDVMLSPVGLLAAYATVLQPYGYLLVLPIAGLIPVFARERRERIGQAIELSAAYRGTALLLGDVLSADDEYTGMHSQDVVALSLTIADALRVDEEERRLVEFGAMLHDIGKIATPPEILNKPGPLDDEEWAIMRQHTITGQQMLDRVGGTLHDVGIVVRASHERYDGRGYPDALVGEQIPLAARIVAVADAYNAMTTRRPYRAPMAPQTALAELQANGGTQFDPDVVAAAVGVLEPGAEDPRAAGELPAPAPAPRSASSSGIVSQACARARGALSGTSAR